MFENLLSRKKYPLLVLTLLLVSTSFALADQESLLKDNTGDGVVSVLAFGDSITYGIGDGLAPGTEQEDLPTDVPAAGYPKRVQKLSGVRVTNAGVPGEELVASGSDRFVRALRNSQADIALILEGANDARLMATAGTYRNSLQRAINAAVALERQPVILTIPRPNANRAVLTPFTDSYTKEQERLAFFNQLPLVDLARAFRTTCDNPNNCNLFNLPNGLHPNTLGYDVIAQTVLATLYGIDIFSESGATDLAGALGIPPTDIKVKPDPGATVLPQP